MAIRGVGFKLLPGATSDAYNITPLRQRIDLSVEPYGPTGDVPQPNFNELIQLRYGRVEQTQPGVTQLPDVQGPHSSDNESDLVTVREGNPEWFGGNWQAYDGVPTQQEVQDAHYTQVRGSGRALFNEALRLRKLENPPPPPPPVDPPPPPVVEPPPPPPPPLPGPPPRTLTAESQQTARDMVNWEGKVVGLKRISRLRGLANELDERGLVE